MNGRAIGVGILIVIDGSFGCGGRMKISIIAACDKNRLIGVDGKMPWQDDARLKEDLKRFKQLTMGHAVVMGTKTKESLNGNIPLPGRKNIVLSSNFKQGAYFSIYSRKDYEYYECSYLKSTLEFLFVTGCDECFLIGGQRIFEEGLQYADTIYLTEVDGEYDGVDQDSKRYFPVLNDSWHLVRAERERGVPCSFMVYRKVV